MKTPSEFTTADIETLEQETVYQGYFSAKKYQLRHRLFAGGWSQPFIREVVERKNAVAALLLDPVLNKVVLVEQFRIGALAQSNKPWLIELVAGVIETGEIADQVARREIYEETGLQPLDVFPVCEYWTSPGGSSEKVSLFCARVDASLAGGIHGLAHENEDIRVWVMDIAKVYDALAQGQINNAMTIIAIQWLQLHEKEVRARWAIE